MEGLQMGVQWTQKYRPRNLDDYIGNEFLKKQLGTLNEQEKLPQTIMFYGEKGTGKTTMARLLVKNLMCESPVHGTACGNCTKCNRLDDEYIQTGKAPQNAMVKELNIADLRGVADAEEIVKDMKKKVAFNKKRVFILDEMQQASKEAQSTFLKIIEEPVANLYVIMCTTHPDKITDALSSRFKRFRIKRPKVTEIASRLEKVSQLEGVNYDKNALRIIAGHHKNNPRESLNQLETLAATTENNLTVREVESQLDIISKNVFEKFLITCKTGNLNNILTLMETIESEGIETQEFVRGVGDFLVDALKIRAGVKLDTYTVEKMKELRKFMRNFEEVDIVNILKVLKEYSNISRDMDFQLYALAAEIMEELKVKEDKKEITDEDAGKKYRSVTKQVVEEQGKKREIRKADGDYLEENVKGARKVVGLPSQVEE